MFLAQLLVIGDLQRHIQRFLVIAAVVDQPRRSGIGEIVGLREIFPAHLHRIFLQLRRHQIHHPFDQVSGFRPARAPIGVGGHFVGEDAGDLHARGGNFVTTGHHQAGECGNERRQQLIVGAEIGDHVAAQSKNASVALHGHFDVVDLVASVNCGLEIFAARLAPFHRLAQLNGQIRNQRLFRIDIEFAAESAAHLRRDNAHQRLGKIQHGSDLRAQKVWNLRGAPHGELPFAGLVIRNHAARLDRHRNQTLVHEALPDHLVRRFERRFQVAALQFPLEGDVVFVARVQRRGAFGDGLLRIYDRRERLVIHFDQIEGVARRVAIARHHHGHGFADEANPVAGQHGPRGRLHVRNLRRARHGLNRAVNVRAGKRQNHAGSVSRFRQIHRTDVRMRVGAAQERGIVHAREV